MISTLIVLLMKCMVLEEKVQDLQLDQRFDFLILTEKHFANM